MSDSFEEYRCYFCGFKARTSARLNSHISQSPACLEKIVAANRPPTNPYKRQRSQSPMPSGGDHIEGQPTTNDLLYSSLLKGQPSTKRTRVDIDEDTPFKTDDVTDEFRPAAGEPHSRQPNMSSDFERLRESQQASGSEPWAPFSSVEDWDYARWIMNSGLSQKQIDEMLALDLVRETSFTTLWL